MTLPGYAAEASLYKTAQLYRGYYSGVSSIDAGASVIPQLDCSDYCVLDDALCIAAATTAATVTAAATGGVLAPVDAWGYVIALALCQANLVSCNSQCPPSGGGGGGGGGGGSTGGCPPGYKCCGGYDNKGKCTEGCIPSTAQCR
jgi:hypothetical protein